VVLTSDNKDKVWIEHENGEMRILSKTWTNLVPHVDPPCIDDQIVRLDLLKVHELSRWIESRKNNNLRSSRAPKKRQSKKKAQHNQGSKKQDEHIRKRRDDGACKMVEQIGSSDGLHRGKQRAKSASKRRSKS
jgi:hypothetical protein